MAGTSELGRRVPAGLTADPEELHNHRSTSRRKVDTPDPDYREVYQQMQKELRKLTNEYGALDLPSWRKR